MTSSWPIRPRLCRTASRSTTRRATQGAGVPGTAANVYAGSGAHRARRQTKGQATITGTTQIFGIIGDPVSHSLSPVMHNAAFASLHLDMAYVPLPVSPAAVGTAVAGLAALGFRGVNVTVPHKTAVVPHLSWLSDDARLVEAVNTIVVDGARLSGYNTDVEGARSALVAACGDELNGAPSLLLGAGGAARAVALALARLGCPLTVANRTPAAAERLVRLLRAAVPGAIVTAKSPTDLSAADIVAHRLIVNATTLGMSGGHKVPALFVDNLCEGHIVFDVVYSRGGTDFLREARMRGATTVDGLDMLIGQAAAAFELWTGQRAPLNVMRGSIAG